MRTATMSRGERGAAATASPRATRAALRVLAEDGSAADAAIAAHLVLAVDSPHATGFGGDLLALLASEGSILAVSGTGRAASATGPEPSASLAGSTVTVPGFAAACADLHRAGGRLPWDRLFDEAIEAAVGGIPVVPALVAAVDGQRVRLRRWAPDSPLLALTAGERWIQPELGDLLRQLRDDGSSAWSDGTDFVIAAIRAAGGAMTAEDLASHRSVLGEPIRVAFADGELAVQPAPSQGILLAMSAQWVEQHRGRLGAELLDHLLVEATGAAFEHRDDAELGAELLGIPLEVAADRATRRRGPRAYLHTAGVATVDADGGVVSSLSSVFDDFGSAVHVPELGIVLNNRAEGFTAGRNRFRPGARPVHTLAPAMFDGPDGVLGIATPGADGQVQTLLSVLTRASLGTPLDSAIAQPRWRSQSGSLLLEDSVEAERRDDLAARGHVLEPRPDGIDAFGAVVAAGHDGRGTYAVADWRRQTEGGAL